LFKRLLMGAAGVAVMAIPTGLLVQGTASAQTSSCSASSTVKYNGQVVSSVHRTGCPAHTDVRVVIINGVVTVTES
jgi:hypothetical protein